MTESRVFLDAKRNVVPEKDAVWLVIHTYEGDELVKEVWIDLKKD